MINHELSRMKQHKHYRTIVISDLHLGTAGSKVREVTAFIKQYQCDTLILNGDIIDGWQLKKYGSWKKKHTGFLRALLKKIEKQNTLVYYLRGNHDDFLDQILPFSIGSNFKIVKDLIYQSGDKKFYVTHGDIFDMVTHKMKWLAHIGDVGYTFLLWLNKLYNQYRVKNGLPYYSLSQQVKGSIKAAVNYVSDFEDQLSEVAKSKNCDGIICGHIHHAAMKEINDIKYMNSGDWVESMTALVEDHDHNWEIVYYAVEKAYKHIKVERDFENVFEDESTEEFMPAYAHLFHMK